MLSIIESESHEILGQRHLTQEETAVIQRQQRQEMDELKAMLQKSGYAIYDGSKGDELMEMLQASGYTIHEVSKEELTDLTED